MSDEQANPGGRPPHAPTSMSRRKVAISAGGGMSHEAIALAMGLSRPTLVKHYAHELTVGAYECRQAALEAIFRAAKKGNVAAAREYLKGAPGVGGAPTELAAEGVKAARNRVAKTAQQGSEWSDVLPRHPSVQ
jgi:hypothetical protein